jgi:hypothetical protein
MSSTTSSATWPTRKRAGPTASCSGAATTPRPQDATAIQTSEGAVTIDAASEYARVQALTGGRTGITITPRRDTGFKLPGL